MAGRESREAFVTLATNDTYSLGCLVLGNSLRQTARTSRQLVIMVTDGVSQPMRNQLARVFDMIYDVNLLDSRDSGNLALLGRPDLSCTFTKLHCWRLTMFDKAVFLDADTLILQNVDELFDREELSAAPDAGWPDCFNSGVFVFRPSEETYQSLLQYALSQGSFDGGDQGLLNMYFRDWATKDISKHLPFIYNVVSQAFYSYLPAFTQFKDNVKIVHFIGATKPWHHPYNTTTGEVTPLPESGHSKEFLQIWWSIFMRYVQPSLDPALSHHMPMPPLTSTSLYEGRISLPPSTFPALIPYIPPNLDHIYYPGTENSECTTDKSRAEVVEVPVVTRLYSDLESHYAEAPLSNVGPDNSSTDLYSVSNVVHRWVLANNRTNDNKTNDIAQTVETSDSKDNECENIEGIKDEKGGLIGELASMTIHSPAGPADQSMLSDQERKLNWERGQMDYLGADRFENIQRKLDISINEDSPSSNVDYTSSPFLRSGQENDVQKEEIQPKPVEVNKEEEPEAAPRIAGVTKSKQADEKPTSTTKLEATSPVPKPTVAAPTTAKTTPEPKPTVAAPTTAKTTPETKPTVAASSTPAVSKAVAPTGGKAAATRPTVSTAQAGASAAPPSDPKKAGVKSPTLTAPADPSKVGGAKSPTSPSAGKLASRLPWMK